MQIIGWVRVYDKIYIQFNSLEEATEYRDFLRDNGYSANMPANTDDFIICIDNEALFDAFRKDCILPYWKK